MRIKTFVVGVAFALALFLFAKRHPDVPQQNGFHGVLELTHANAQEPESPPTSERLVAPLVVLDVSSEVRENPDYQVGVADIAKWEQANGIIPAGAVVMARTGWDLRWFTPESYRNADRHGVPHFPGYSESAAKFLVETRNVRGLGIDTPSVDPGSARKPVIEPFTLAHGVYHLENVANLDRTPQAGGQIVVAASNLESRPAIRLFALTQ